MRLFDAIRTRRCRKTATLLALAMLSAAACHAPPPEAGPVSKEQPLISDQVHHDGTPGFFFLPPLVPLASYGRATSAGLSPVVRIDELGGRGTIAVFTRASGPGGARVVEGPGFYVAVWPTRLSNLDPRFTYRVRVLVQELELGFIDLQVVTSPQGVLEFFRKGQAEEYGLVFRGASLPIAFRIEPRALRCLGVTCEARDACHLPGSCDPHTGACSAPPAADGTACDDGDACTDQDACLAGSCQGGPRRACLALDDCHLEGTCDAATGACTAPTKSGGLGCVSADGGVLELPGGGTLTVPPQAVSAPVYLYADPVPLPSLDALFAGAPLSLSEKRTLTAFEFRPHGLVFARPITIRERVDAAVGAGRTPVHMGFDASSGRTWLEPSSIRLAQATELEWSLTHLSGHAIADTSRPLGPCAYADTWSPTACADPSRIENACCSLLNEERGRSAACAAYVAPTGALWRTGCCREVEAYIESNGQDSNTGDRGSACQISSDGVTVRYPACENSTAESSNLAEVSADCAADIAWTLGIAGPPSIAACSTAHYEAVLSGRSPGGTTVGPQVVIPEWQSLVPSRADFVAPVGTLRGLSPGAASINAHLPLVASSGASVSDAQYRVDVAACDDGNACTVQDTCTDTGCAGTPIACPQHQDPCYEPYACDPAVGCLTVALPRPDGTACPEGVCVSGQCRPCLGPAPDQCPPGTILDPQTCTCAPGTVSIDPPTATMVPGEERTFVATPNPADGCSVAWTSSSDAVRVGASGKAMAMRFGVAFLTATCGAASGSALVRVVCPPDTYYEPSLDDCLPDRTYRGSTGQSLYIASYVPAAYATRPFLICEVFGFQETIASFSYEEHFTLTFHVGQVPQITLDGTIVSTFSCAGTTVGGSYASTVHDTKTGLGFGVSDANYFTALLGQDGFSLFLDNGRWNFYGLVEGETVSVTLDEMPPCGEAALCPLPSTTFALTR